MEASELSFDLEFGPLILAVSDGSVLLNEATNASKVDWRAVAPIPVPNSTVKLDGVTDLTEFVVGGTIQVELGSFVTVSGSVTIMPDGEAYKIDITTGMISFGFLEATLPHVRPGKHV